MTLEEVLAWMKTLSVKPDHYYCGTLNAKKPKSFGLYQLETKQSRQVAIGGLSATKSARKGATILVHWNESSRESENTALSLYQAIEAAANAEIGHSKVSYIELPYNEPICVGTDDHGIFEFVIDVIFHYERS